MFMNKHLKVLIIKVYKQWNQIHQIKVTLNNPNKKSK